MHIDVQDPPRDKDSTPIQTISKSFELERGPKQLIIKSERIQVSHYHARVESAM